MDLERALKDPAAAFDSPEAVLGDERLNSEQKLRILEQWQQDARLLEEAAAENMAGGEPNLLHRVSEAILRLKG
jgi:hypothetical protein